MSAQERFVLLKILCLSPDGRTITANEAEFERSLRDACVELFGQCSGLIDFSVVDVASGQLTVKTSKSDLTRLWSALTLADTAGALYAVTETSVVPS